MTIEPVVWFLLYAATTLIITFVITSILDQKGFAPSKWEIFALSIFWVPIAWIVLVMGIVNILLEFPKKFFPAAWSVTAKILEMFFERPVDKF